MISFSKLNDKSIHNKVGVFFFRFSSQLSVQETKISISIIYEAQFTFSINLQTNEANAFVFRNA